MNWKNWAYCTLITLGHLVYTVLFPSIVNGERFFKLAEHWLEPSYIHSFFLSRLKFGEFARRPVTTYLIQSLESLGLSLETAFILVLYAGLFLAVILLFKLAKNLSNESAARWSVFIFMTSFWVLNAFFTEIYAYDEPWQYAFLFAAFECLRLKNWFRFSLLFLLALVTRESSLLLLPGIFLFFIIDQPLFSKSNLLRSLKVLWTLPMYGFILWILVQGKELEEKSSSYMRDERFKHLFYSFETIDLGIVTLTSFLAAFVFPLLIIILNRHRIQSNLKPWIYAFIINFGLNSFITFFFTMGRETRIFAQPVLMISPILGFLFLDFYRRKRHAFNFDFSSFHSFSKSLAGLVFLTCLFFAFSLFAYEIYWPTETKFFTGFQHWIYLSFCQGALLIYMHINVHSSRAVRVTGVKKFNAVVFLLPVLLFFGNRHGYRSFSVFDPIVSELEHTDGVSESPYLIVASSAPNLAENYFRAKGVDALAGDFNFQLPVKQFLYRRHEFENRQLVFLELYEAKSFPFKYMLSQLGRTKKTSIAGYPALTIDVGANTAIEQQSFVLRGEAFQAKTALISNAPWFEFSDEYSPALKMTLSQLQDSSLTSFVAKVDFDCLPSSEAAIVLTIDIPNKESLWFHEFLSVFWVDEHNKENVAFKGEVFEKITDPNASIAFYIWNPKRETIRIRNAEVVFNSTWME